MRQPQHSVAENIVRIVAILGRHASFRSIWLETRRGGLIAWDRTLRKYLDLLVLAGVLNVRQKDVGSVYPQQLYAVASNVPRVWVGLRILRERGLNWEVPEDDFWRVDADYEAVVRAKTMQLRSQIALGACLEDCLAFEAKRDTELNSGRSELVVAMLATTRLDLAYLLRRADSIGIGVTFRRLYQRIEKTLTGFPVDSEGRLFLQVRAQFLKTARQYARQGLFEIVKSGGIGRMGLDTIVNLSEAAIINAAAKQLGITG